MQAGQKYIICGLSRLAVRVARRLSANQVQVTILTLSQGHERLLGELGDEIEIVHPQTGEDLSETLGAAGIAGAHCLLALAEDDLDNLRAIVAARSVAPDLPAVLRAFDPALAQGLEQGLNIRRAYSVSALAAPAFVAAAFGDHVLETLRLGDGEVPICVVTVRDSSPLANLTPAAVDERFGCRVIARDFGADGVWKMIPTDSTGDPLAEGEKILIGGLLGKVLALVGKNATLAANRRPRSSKRLKRRSKRSSGSRAFSFRHTRLPAVAISLLIVLVISVIVFASALKLSIVDAIYFVITTATTTGYGDISLKDAPWWLKLFGNVVMLTGGALLGVLFSYLAAITTTERLEEMMGQRASRMEGHVVVAGLGNVGYRVVRSLRDLGADVAAIELLPDARFVEALREQVPVLAGDARLSETLERASIADAAVFIACTNNDLANIEACLHAKRLNPAIRTVARVYEDLLAEKLTRAFQIDAALSASQIAAGAFFGAAADERAMRPIHAGELNLLACRLTVVDETDKSEIESARNAGVTLLAVRPPSGDLRPPGAQNEPLEPGSQVIACGPARALRELASRIDGSAQNKDNSAVPDVSLSAEVAKI